MLEWLDFLLDKLLSLMGRNKLLTKIGKKILLSRYIRKGLERIYHFYAVARFEEGLDPFIGGYYSHPWIASPYGLLFNVEVSEKNLLDIKRILDKAGVRFWLAYGTFLGAYRDQAIIPYDGDTDLAIYAEDLPKLGGCEDAFHKEGFYLAVGSSRATVYRYGEHTDFCFFKLDGNKRVRKLFKYDASAFEILNEIQFLGQKWRILNEPERWLKYTFGEDWRTPMKEGDFHYPHGEKFESA